MPLSAPAGGPPLGRRWAGGAVPIVQFGVADGATTRQSVPVADEWERVRAALREAGVAGVEDLGRFVNNTKYFEPSRLDEAAAAPVLLRLLPELENERLVRTIGRHLQSKSVSKECYDRVLAAYRKWGRLQGETGWVLGDTLARKADKSRADDFLSLASDRDFGASRAFIVDALWRFKSVVDVEPLLRALIREPDVSVYAMSALQRTIGVERMASTLRELLDEAPDGQVVEHARRQLKRVEKKRKQGS